MANQWAAGLAAHYNFNTVYDLVGRDMKLLSRPAIYPGSSPRSSNAPSLIGMNLFEKTSDLIKVFDIGSHLESHPNIDTNGANCILLFLEFTAKRMAPPGIGSAILGGENSSMLSLAEGRDTVPLGQCDILYLHHALPPVYGSVNYLPAHTTASSSALAVQAATPTVAHGAMRENPPPLPVPSTGSPPQQVTMADVTKLVGDALRGFSDEHNKATAHLADLMRTQLQIISSPELKHANSGTGRPSPHGTYMQSQEYTPVSAHEHRADTARKNISGFDKRPPDSIQRQQYRPRTTPRYMDKPAIRWPELSPDCQSWLGTALGINDEAAWERDSVKMCPLCGSPSAPANHLLNRCIRCFCRTEKGMKYYGAKTHAQQLRFALSQSGNHMNLASVLALADGSCETSEDARDAAQFVVDAAVDSSSALSLFFAGALHLDDSIAVAEFDRAYQHIADSLTLPHSA